MQVPRIQVPMALELPKGTDAAVVEVAEDVVDEETRRTKAPNNVLVPCSLLLTACICVRIIRV